MKALRIMTLLVLAGALGFVVSCSSGGGGGGGGQEICNNQIDDDGDGFTDCDDSECTNALNCTAQCGNGQCEAGETATSCPADCSVANEICNNQMDDDGDGFTDCDDADCTSDPACQGSGEICNNQIDDDGDGSIDCADSDCTSDPACQGTGGDLSCIGMEYCMFNCCGSSDTACQTACGDAATSTAQSQLTALNNCLSTNCSSECGSSGTQAACSTCIDQHCSAENAACDWGGTGSAGCMTTYGCLAGNGSTIQGCAQPASSGTAATCPSDAGMLCYQDCFAATDQTSMDLLFAMNDCIVAATDTGGACKTDCDTDPAGQACTTCIQTACGSDISACQSDG